MNKYDSRYEHQIRELAENRIRAGSYKIFDDRARIITRKTVDGDDCLMIANSEGEVFALSPLFQVALLVALNAHFK